MIRITLPGLPPSSNRAYFNVGHVRVLTKEGKAYKLRVKTLIAQTYHTELKQFVPNVPYSVFIEFVFHGEWALANKGYPEKTENRYKKLDITNRLKLLEDAVADATGVDDSHSFFIAARKRYSTTEEDHTIVHIWGPDDAVTPVQDFYAAAYAS